jgi:mannose-6-phosphate isomerase-like protein (cupin superfamily)
MAKTAAKVAKGRAPARHAAGAKVGRKAIARRPKAKAAARPKAKRPAQRFTVSHLDTSAFVQGLRRYAQYRDLGISAATDGMVQAHVVRFQPPFRAEEVAIPHYHDVEFQMIYVLKGSMTSEFEGQGTITMRAGSCWIQPPRVKHKVVDYSDDCEVLEIVLPADFETVELA